MRAAAVLLVSMLAVGCGSDGDVTAAAPSPVGTWNLQSIGGTVLPYLAYDNTAQGRLELVNEVLVIHANTFTITASFRETYNGTTSIVADSVVGWASITGTSALLTSTEAGIVVTGKVDGTRMTIDDGVPFVYLRRE